jgi:HEAT repeat protein
MSTNKRLNDVAAYIKELRDAVSSKDYHRIGRASCDLAQRIWDGEVSDELLIELLTDKNDVVRSQIAWAVADAHRPACGVAWLFEHGLYDKSAAVRRWAMFALGEESGVISPSHKARAVEMLEDESENVRRIARKVVDQWTDRGNPGGTR